MARNDRELDQARKELFEVLAARDEEYPDLAERADRLENFELKDGILHFTLKRHPHVFGHPSKGHASPGFEVRVQRYTFDPKTKEIDERSEELADVDIDVGALVDEDIDLNFRDADPMSFYEGLTTEAEVRVAAQRQAATQVEEIIESTVDNMLNDPEDGSVFDATSANAIRGEFRERWTETYVEKVVESWRERREEEELGEE